MPTIALNFERLTKIRMWAEEAKLNREWAEEATCEEVRACHLAWAKCFEDMIVKSERLAA